MVRQALPILLILTSCLTTDVRAQEMKPAQFIEKCKSEQINSGAISYIEDNFKIQEEFRKQTGIDVPSQYKYINNNFIYFIRNFSMPSFKVDSAHIYTYIIPKAPIFFELVEVALDRMDSLKGSMYRVFNVAILLPKGSKNPIKEVKLDQIVLEFNFQKDYGESTYYAYNLRLETDGPFPTQLTLDDLVIDLYE